MVSTLWGGKRCNISQVNELSQMMIGYFGPGVAECI